MTTTLMPSVLIVDDDNDFRSTLEFVIDRWGYPVRAVATSEAMRAALATQAADIVLLDKNLAGAEGAEEGLATLTEIKRSSPECFVLMMTGYADERSVERAFDSGAFDYLTKDAVFRTILGVKLAQLTRLVLSERARRAGEVERETTIAATWVAAKTETNSQKKGRLLEALLSALFKSIPGFEHVTANERSTYEEFDLLVRNESTEAFWRGEGTYLLVECKNWRKPVGKNEIQSLIAKAERRYGRVRLAFLVAPGGFAKTVSVEVATERKGTCLVILLDADALDALVASPERRDALLREHHQRAVTGAP